ncbi:MAG TPA: hypothetical protein VNZ57_03600 [Longimicrobiales bacterium]|nr:hypothetical protein [Longimicrobiales bacterium]
MRTLALVICLLAVARVAKAQSCMGTPMPIGSIAVIGGASMAEGVRTLSAGLAGYHFNRLGWAVRGGLLSFDDASRRGMEGRAHMGITVTPPGRISACPHFGVTYSWQDKNGDGRDASQFADADFMFGVGYLGQTGSGRTYTVFGVPRVSYGWRSVPGIVVEDMGLYVGGTIGAGVNVGRLIVTGYGSFSTDERTSTVVGAHVGVVVN